MDARGRIRQLNELNPLEFILAIPIVLYFELLRLVYFLTGARFACQLRNTKYLTWAIREWKPELYFDERNISPLTERRVRWRAHNRLADEANLPRPFPDEQMMPSICGQCHDNVFALEGGYECPWPNLPDVGGGPGIPSNYRELRARGRQFYTADDEHYRRYLPVPKPRRQVHRYPGSPLPQWLFARFLLDTPANRTEEEKNNCVICREELPEKLSIAKPCNHRFCVHCLEEWITYKEKERKTPTCPYCFKVVKSIESNEQLGYRIAVVWRRFGGAQAWA
ncbi:hypothetical protein EAF04_002015 [Stromatinia cepivora]|nr:hypothetical protein EAF04_002015 [Stromatinia cepivora]